MPIDQTVLDRLDAVVVEVEDLLNQAVEVVELGADGEDMLYQEQPATGYDVNDVDILDRLLTTARAARDELAHTAAL
jgi:hypothetical protein